MHRERLITLVRDRFTERYLRPIQSSTQKSGFLTMSVACFMIETLQCFRLGLISSHEPDLLKVLKNRYSCSEQDARDKLFQFKQKLKGGMRGSSVQQLVFESFFINNKAFVSQDRFDGLDFYGSVRNGLLHQSETKNGWKIWRKRDSRFYWIGKDGHRILNADRFLERLETYLCGYCTELASAKWDAPLWRRCRQKLGYICENCKSPHHGPESGV